jgi:hypothetical protein
LTKLAREAGTEGTLRMSNISSPIHDLVESRLKDLGIRRGELARRCGFKNVSKGLRRIEAMCRGDFDSPCAGMILKALPTALELDRDVVDVVVRETASALDQSIQTAAAERRAASRTSFKPCAYLCGTEARPSSVTVYGLSGGPERWLKISLDYSRPPLTYAAQALAIVRKTPVVHFFGPTTGFIVNYTPDCAVRFDLDGSPIERFPAAHSPDQIELQIGRCKISADRFGRIMGFLPLNSN